MSEQDERSDLANYEQIEAAYRALPPDERYSNYTVINASQTLPAWAVKSEVALLQEFADARNLLHATIIDQHGVAFVSLAGPAGAIADVAADMIAVGYACAG